MLHREPGDKLRYLLVGTQIQAGKLQMQGANPRVPLLENHRHQEVAEIKLRLQDKQAPLRLGVSIYNFVLEMSRSWFELHSNVFFPTYFLFFARAKNVLYCGIRRKFSFDGFSSVFLACTGVCSVTVLT